MLRETTLPLGMQAELMPTASAEVGNVYALADLGSNLRLGQYIPYDYGLSRVQPGSSGDGGFNAERFGWHVLAGFEGRAVARDIFLDGNTFRDSRSADKEPFIGDASSASRSSGPMCGSATPMCSAQTATGPRRWTTTSARSP